MIEKTGVPTRQDVLEQFPERIVLVKPKAIIECYKEIPCNPCSTSCPFDAIHIPEDINIRPVIDFDACTGCGICVYQCPGLAITVMQVKADKVIMKIPYEFTPLPQVGAQRNVLDRTGSVITKGTILKVQTSPVQEKTALIHIEIDSAFLYDAITIEVTHG
ncbi:MAG: 4Fe-4S ferredoxin [Acholeplasmatales bacterium]|nr:MAG: 4Fe-4S ferredoxin [Acholeplasmatales bacterium]